MTALKLMPIVLAAILWCTAAAAPARADPFIPPAGAGTLTIWLKSISGNRNFSPAFGTSTKPSHSSITETRLQVTGTLGLGGPWELQFDLRAANDTRSAKAEKGRPAFSSSASGLQDQQIGIVRGLTASRYSAQAVGLNVVVPTGTTAVNAPSLGAGHFAFEPQYQLGVRGAAPGSYAVLGLGLRFYAGGAGTQLRATAEAGRRLTRELTGKVSAFYSTNLGDKNSPAFVEYNVLRGGAYLELRHGRLRPEIGYERDIAGAGLHAEQRLDFALTMHY